MSFKKYVRNLTDSIRSHINVHKKNDNIIFKLIDIRNRKIENNKKVYDVQFLLGVEDLDDYTVFYNLIFDKELNISVSSHLLGQVPNIKYFHRILSLDEMDNLVYYILQEYMTKSKLLENNNSNKEFHFSDIGLGENVGIDYSIVGGEQEQPTLIFEESHKGNVIDFMKNKMSSIKDLEESSDETVRQAFKQIDYDVKNFNSDVKLNNPYLEIIREIVNRIFKDPDLKESDIKYFNNILRISLNEKQIDLNIKIPKNYEQIFKVNFSGSVVETSLNKNFDSNFDWVVNEIKQKLELTNIKDQESNKEDLNSFKEPTANDIWFNEIIKNVNIDCNYRKKDNLNYVLIYKNNNGIMNIDIKFSSDGLSVRADVKANLSSCEIFVTTGICKLGKSGIDLVINKINIWNKEYLNLEQRDNKDNINIPESQNDNNLSDELLNIIELLNKRLCKEQEFERMKYKLTNKLEDNSLISIYKYNNKSLELCITKLEDLVSISIDQLKLRKLFNYKTLNENKFDPIVDIFKENFIENKDMKNKQEEKPKDVKDKEILESISKRLDMDMLNSKLTGLLYRNGLDHKCQIKNESVFYLLNDEKYINCKKISILINNKETFSIFIYVNNDNDIIVKVETTIGHPVIHIPSTIPLLKAFRQPDDVPGYLNHLFGSLIGFYYHYFTKTLFNTETVEKNETDININDVEKILDQLEKAYGVKCFFKIPDYTPILKTMYEGQEPKFSFSICVDKDKLLGIKTNNDDILNEKSPQNNVEGNNDTINPRIRMKFSELVSKFKDNLLTVFRDNQIVISLKPEYPNTIKFNTTCHTGVDNIIAHIGLKTDGGLELKLNIFNIENKFILEIYTPTQLDEYLLTGDNPQELFDKLLSCLKQSITNNLSSESSEFGFNPFLPLGFNSLEEYNYYKAKLREYFESSVHRNGRYGSNKDITNNVQNHNDVEKYRLLDDQVDVELSITKKGISEKKVKKFVKKLEKYLNKVLDEKK